MKGKLIFMFTAWLTIASCTKTEIVSGTYKGLATGYNIGTNVNSTIKVTAVDSEKVDLKCDFNGLQQLYTHATVYRGNNDKYYITEASGLSATVQNGDMHFQYIDAANAQNDILFTGSK